MLRIRIWDMEVEDRASTIEYPTICHRMTHNFAKESFCNEDHMKKICLARRRLHSKERGKKGQRDHLSYPELYILIRMNYQIRRDWFVVRRSK